MMLLVSLVMSFMCNQAIHVFLLTLYPLQFSICGMNTAK